MSRLQSSSTEYAREGEPPLFFQKLYNIWFLKSAKQRDNFNHPIKSTANTAVLITKRQREISSLTEGGGVQESSERLLDREGARLCKGGW